MDSDIDNALGSLWRSRGVADDLHTLCSFGGRLAGTESEFRAREYVDQRLNEMPGIRKDFAFPFRGRLPVDASIRVHGDSDPLRAVALPGSPRSDGIEVELIDVGLGSESDFRSMGDRLRGTAVLVRHEYPFATNHTHRRRKYALAKEFGCTSFIIANNIPGIGPVTGGCGEGDDADIPGLGVSFEAAEVLKRKVSQGRVDVVVSVETSDSDWSAHNFILDMPGSTGKYVLVGAHLDGHALAQSAIDNATGVAAALAIGDHFPKFVDRTRLGLRLALFTVEEWGLAGSRRYLEAGSRSPIAQEIEFAVILDSITGHPSLCALTGGNVGLEDFVGTQARSSGIGLDLIRPKIANSDHYSFQSIGIPALRLIAGYGRAESLTRFLLTAADTEALVTPAELKGATLTAANLVYSACSSAHVSMSLRDSV